MCPDVGTQWTTPLKENIRVYIKINHTIIIAKIYYPTAHIFCLFLRQFSSNLILQAIIESYDKMTTLCKSFSISKIPLYI